MHSNPFEAIRQAQMSAQRIFCHTITAADNSGDGGVLADGFFIALVTNGTAEVSASDACRFEAGPRDLLLLTPSMRATFESTDDDFAMTCLGFDPDYFDSLRDGQTMYSQLARFIRQYGYPLLHIRQGAFDYLRRTLGLFLATGDGSPLGHDAISERLCGFLLLQVTDLLFHSNATHGPLYVKRSDLLFRDFKKLLIANYRSHHRIEFYADALHISTTYLARTVKRLTGRTVRFHITELLYADARRMLESTDMEVKQIADTLGFSGQSVFGKFFTKRTGLSPVKYRMRRH